MDAEVTELSVADERPPGDVQPAGYTFASFWRRSVAFTIDCAVLTLVGHILGALEGGPFSAMRGFAPLVGLFLMALYFGIPNSVLGRGQTPGKKLMGLRVVARDGSYIALGRSLGRAALLGVPFMANRIWFPPSSPLLWPDFVRTGIVWALGGATTYLYLFNVPTRQTLHDLVWGTMVVQAASTGQTSVTSVARVHLAVVSGWLCLVVALHVGTAWRVVNGGLFSESRKMKQSIAADTNVARVGLVYRRVYPGGQSAMLAQVWDVLPPVSDEAQARDVARALIRALPRAQSASMVEVKITTGWDIGVASYWWNHRLRDTPDNWLARERPGPPAPRGP